jgi:hypothetical protein
MNELRISVSIEIGWMFGPVGVAMIGSLYSMFELAIRAALMALARRCPLCRELDRGTQSGAIVNRSIERDFDIVWAHDRGRGTRLVE